MYSLLFWEVRGELASARVHTLWARGNYVQPHTLYIILESYGIDALKQTNKQHQHTYLDMKTVDFDPQFIKKPECFPCLRFHLCAPCRCDHLVLLKPR